MFLFEEGLMLVEFRLLTPLTPKFGSFDVLCFLDLTTLVGDLSEF